MSGLYGVGGFQVATVSNPMKLLLSCFELSWVTLGFDSRNENYLWTYQHCVSLFITELLIILKCFSTVDECIEYDTLYIGYPLYKANSSDNYYGKTNNAEACQQKCRETSGCRWFNWSKEMNCYLKKRKGKNKQVEKGGASGPRKCKGKYITWCPNNLHT